AARKLVGDAADALELARRRGSPFLARAAAAQDRTQKQDCGRGAAERANGRVLVWGPHWAVRLYGESSERARADPGKGKARRSGGRCGGLSRLLPARRPQTPRFASPSGREARARLRRGQWAVR